MKGIIIGATAGLWVAVAFSIALSLRANDRLDEAESAINILDFRTVAHWHKSDYTKATLGCPRWPIGVRMGECAREASEHDSNDQ